MARSLDILVVSQFFHPEMGAPAARFHDFGRLLIERGHRVTVVTGFPNSPSGVVPEAYRGRPVHEEDVDGIRVLRTWFFTSPRLSAVTKSLGFGTFALSASARVLFSRLRADVVIATAPPPTVAIPGWLAKQRLGAPLVFDVRDIWPEAIAESGRLQSGLLVRLLEAIERRAYAAASAVTVVTEGKRVRMHEKGVAPEKVDVVSNGVDVARFDRIDPDGAALLEHHGVDRNRFVVLYAGIFNPPQGLDILLDLPARVPPEVRQRLQVVLVGNGAERARLASRVAEEGLSEVVRMLPEQARDRIPGLLQAADAVAVTLRPRRDAHTVPSKIYEALASGHPVLLSADGAPAEIVQESGGGLTSPSADREALAANVTALVTSPERCAKLGRAGRRYVERHDRRIHADHLEALLCRVVDEAARG